MKKYKIGYRARIQEIIFNYLKSQPVIEAHHTDGTLTGMSIVLSDEIIELFPKRMR
jgi:hypothetical protein